MVYVILKPKKLISAIKGIIIFPIIEIRVIGWERGRDINEGVDVLFKGLFETIAILVNRK